MRLSRPETGVGFPSVHAAPRRHAALSSGLALLLSAAAARAQAHSPDGLRYDLRGRHPRHGGAVGLGVALALLKGDLAPASCRVCAGVDGSDALDAPDRPRGPPSVERPRAPPAPRATGPAFFSRRSPPSRWPRSPPRPTSAFHDAPANALVVVEATALAVALNGVVKLVVARQRPYAHFRDSSLAPPDPDENLSFYSGHTNLAFAVAVASGTVASMRGYRLAPVVWATSLPWAAVTGYLRIAADRHYLTDVLTGALIGSAVGFLVPFVFHRAPASTPDAADPARASGAAGAVGGAIQQAAAAHGPFVTGSWTF